MREIVELDAPGIIEVLSRHKVEYVVVGGLAAVLHGSPMITSDMDITPRRTRTNLQRLCNALIELEARLWPPGADEPVDWRWDPDAFASLTVASTRTRFGDLDINLQIDGPDVASLDYEALNRDALTIEIPHAIRVASLDDVIASKQAANRDKDRRMLPLLRALRERLNREA